MAFLQASFFSHVLEKEVGMNVILPDAGRGPFPVFYLLHGLSDDYTMWQRRTRVEWYVRELPLIVVMPDGFRSFYTDHHAGPAYGRYFVEDVMGFAERAFPAAARREGRAIGGLSMGGYGSMRLALANPKLFASVCGHSGVMDLLRPPFPRGASDEYKAIFGPRPRGTAHDLFAMSSKLRRSGARLPKLRFDCGTEDRLLGMNRAFDAHLTRLKIAHEYEEFPGGHEWDYWDARLREALAFHARALKLGSRRALKRLGNG